MTFPNAIWILLLVCAVLCAVGFYKFVYFISIGYGFAIAGAGLFLVLYFQDKLSLAVTLQCVVFMIYGIRLAGFLLIREFKSKSYRKTVAAANKGEKKYPVFIKILIWLCVSILYVMQVSPVFFRLVNGDPSDAISYGSLVIMIVAVVIEAEADRQKSAAKKKDPNRFCDEGLYLYVRCPNYFGEILLWTGVFISGFTTLQSVGQWCIAIAGYLLIVYVMLSGAKRLEERQDRNYGSSREYVNYKKMTPILLPVVPIYSLQNCKWIKT